MRVMMMAAEAAPYVKVGGLADVVGALSREFAAQGTRVELILPGYRALARRQLGFEFAGKLDFTYHGRRADVDLHRLALPHGAAVIVVDDPAAFDRDGIYDDPATREGYRDNPERYAFFARACAELARRDPPDLIHVHDSHAALVPGLLDCLPGAPAPPSVLTIHNLAHQMHCDPEVLFGAGFPRERFFPMSPLEFHGAGNFLKAGIHHATALTTVSPRYAREIQTAEFGCGLDGALRQRAGDLSGILNGIDTAEWNPATDRHLAARFAPDDLRGKAACRADLLHTAGLQAGPSTALFGLVGRLVDQKGIDILLGAAPGLLREDVRLVILGSGQEKYHVALEELRRRHPDRVALYLGFHDVLAHKIEAGADFFLMPSRFEPCGLNQMYSLNYGTIPIVRRTGGLADTVVDCLEAPRAGTGFLFDGVRSEALLDKALAALELFRDGARRIAVMRRGMAQDFSSRRSAARYLELFRRVAR